MASPRKWVIPLDAIPEHQAVHIYIFEQTDILSYVDKFLRAPAPTYLELPLTFDLDRLRSDVLRASEEIGLFPFSYGGVDTEKDIYMSASLTWNPDSRDNVSTNPHQATLGSRNHRFGSASLYGAEKSDKNSYTDGMSFNRHTPLAGFGAIGDLTRSFSRTLIRSRISTLKAGRRESMRFDFGWHNDELVFVNLRVNVPVVSSPDYAIQIITEQSEETFKVEEFSLTPGKAYAYDTSKNHRPFCKKLCAEDRVNMIYGVSPWFDFDPEARTWVSNEYYGEVHPFDMLRQGLVSTAIHA
jgi:hypothetical protein